MSAFRRANPNTPPAVDATDTALRGATPPDGQSTSTRQTNEPPGTPRTPKSANHGCLVIADRKGRVPAALLNALQARSTSARIAASLPAAMVELAKVSAQFVIVVDPLMHPSASRQLEFIHAVHAQHPGTAIWGFTQQNGHPVLQPLDRILGPDGQICRWRSLMVATSELPQSPLRQPLVSEQELAMLLSIDHNETDANSG